MRRDRYSANDDRFEQLLEDLRFRVVETELTPEKRAARRARCDEDEQQWLTTYFGAIFDSPWNAVHHHVASLKEGKHTVSGFRRSGKSAYTYLAKIVRPMVLGEGDLSGIALRTQDKAIARGEGLMRLIKANRLLSYDYDITWDQDRAGHWIVNGTHLIATSYSVGLRAYVDDNFKRFRRFVADDLYDRTTVTSELDNTRVVEFVTSEIDGQLEDGGLRIVLGNSITETCPIVQLKEQFPANHFELPALDEDGQSTWPGRFSTEYWLEFAAETPDEVWLGDYMCQPALKGDFFDDEWIRFVPAIASIQVLASITCIDPAHGESPSACFKAAVTASALSNGKIRFEDLWLRRDPYSTLFGYLLEISRTVPAWKVALFEDDFSQWAYAQPYYAAWTKRTGATLPIMKHSAKEVTDGTFGTDKDSRIISLVHPHQTGVIEYADHLKSSKDYERYRLQLLSFGKSKEKLDGPDAAATAFHMVRRYVSTGSFKALAERERKKPRFSLRGWFS